MAAFQMKIAGQVAQIHPLFESTAQYFRAYLTEEAPDFSCAVTPDSLRFEQAELDEEARLEGFRYRTFTDPFLERAAIQRAFAEHLFDRDTLLFHGSAVALEGRGYLFAAPCGTGKSTHARLWREVLGAVAVNDDKPFLRLTEQGAMLYGSPWQGKHGIGANLTVPLAGICLLERGSENGISSLSPQEALPMLLRHCCESESLVKPLCQAVLLWKLACTISPEAAELAYNTMK
jgi:hypothetical protein